MSTGRDWRRCRRWEILHDIGDGARARQHGDGARASLGRRGHALRSGIAAGSRRAAYRNPARCGDACRRRVPRFDVTIACPVELRCHTRGARIRVPEALGPLDPVVDGPYPQFGGRRFESDGPACMDDYLDGKIAVVPRFDRLRREPFIFLCGQSVLFEKYRQSLLSLGGKPTYVGEDAGRSARDSRFCHFFSPQHWLVVRRGLHQRSDWMSDSFRLAPAFAGDILGRIPSFLQLTDSGDMLTASNRRSAWI